MQTRNVPKATLGRLPGYLKYLNEIKDECKTVSATTISKALGLGEVQVRKDLGTVSGEGKPKIGYVTEELIAKLEDCLGQKEKHKAVIVGAGKLGRALLDYEGFADYGLEIAAAFDAKTKKKEASDAGKPIYPHEIDPGKNCPDRAQIIVDRLMERIAQIERPNVREV